ncbi:autotransporter-associated beta strand repeat-containing protein [Luteolibacter sp. LG18]|uniref:beta strand repeat-containing protein n=1 Tax=Luteolibacter sp. LG18 TaxID=2819286 RepID=UPI002B288146|nr:hypothetical protein llg_22970 [Luteolibacter sp. LG18]
MKPKFTGPNASPLGNFLVFCLGIVSVGTFLCLDSAHAANQTWDGGASATGTDFGTAANWTNDTLPTTAGDTAIFDGQVAGNLVLSYTNTNFGGGAGQAGLGVSLTANQTGSVSIDSSGNQLRLSGISNASSSAAFALGDGAGSNFNVIMGNGTPHAFLNNSSGLASIGSEVVFSALGGGGAHAFAFDGTGNWALNGTISVGGVAITKSGTGTLTISSTANNSGGATVNAGIVAIGGAGKLGATTSTLALAGGSLNLGGTTQTVGAVTVSAGAASGDTISNGSLSATTLAISSVSGSVTLSSAISTSGALSKSNAANAVLTGNNAVTGDLTMNGAGNLTLSGTNTVGGNFSHTGGNGFAVVSAGSTTVTGSIQYLGTGSNFRVSGGSLAAAGATTSGNSAFRNLEFNGGELRLNGDAFTGSAAVALIFNGGTLKSGSATGITIYDADNTFDVNAGGAIFDTTIGDISTGSNVNSANIRRLNGTTGGSVTIKGGKTLHTPVTNTGIIVLQDGSVWDTNGSNSTVGGLSGTTGTIGSSGTLQTVTLNVAAGSLAYGGIVSSGATLTKAGVGTQSLAGNNAISTNANGTSAIRVEAGTLALGGNNAISAVGAATSAGNLINVVGAATVELTGHNTLTPANGVGITVGGGGVLSVNSIANALSGATQVNLGGNTNSGRLLYTGAGETTALVIGSTAGTSSSAIVDQSGAGNLKFSSNTALSGGIQSLTLQGSTAGTGEFAGIIANGASTGMQLIKTGTGKWTLSGANTYTGDTNVLGGVLAVSGNSIPDAGKLVIDGGKIAATGTEVVATLYFGTIQQPGGTWGATGSGATHIDDTHFSGTTGVVSVASGPANTYSVWAATNAGNQSADMDYDSDGVRNGVEYFMGQGGSSFTANPVPVNGTITWPKDPSFSGLYEVQTSSDLINWTPVTVADNGTSVSYTLPTGQGKLFARLIVLPN